MSFQQGEWGEGRGLGGRGSVVCVVDSVVDQHVFPAGGGGGGGGSVVCGG